MMEIKLIDWYGKSVGSVSWDPKRGTLTGDLADELKDLIESAVQAGGVNSHPLPTWHEIKNPLLSESEMAVVISTRWKIPDQLKSSYPDIRDDSPEDSTP